MRHVAAVVLLACAGCVVDGSAKVAAFGDSVTWGYGGERGGWVTDLERSSGVEIANLGVPGETAETGARRIAEPDGLALSPAARVVLVLEGGNDTIHFLHSAPCNDSCNPELVAEKFEGLRKDLRKIRSSAAKNHRRVVFGQYWPGSAFACADEFPGAEFGHFRAFFQRTNQILTEVAAEHGDAVVELDDLITLSDDPANYHDCFHPSAQGYATIAARWLEDRAVWAPADDGTWDN